jgi:sulfoxide reductase heme-binding subunit YedZ
MSSNTAWYLTRSTGIVATVLILASLAWGLLFSARETGKRLRPNWWLDLHNWLGGLALTFTAFHMLFVVASSHSGYSVASLFVPGKAKYLTTAITFGVVAFYGIAIASLTSPTKIRRKIPRRAWHAIHLISIPATVFAVLHAVQAGSDKTTFAFRALLVLFVGASVYPLALRVIGIGVKKLDRAR